MSPTLNRLPFNEVQEGRTVDSFHAALELQCAEYLKGTRSKPLPPWRLIAESVEAGLCFDRETPVWLKNTVARYSPVA